MGKETDEKYVELIQRIGSNLFEVQGRFLSLDKQVMAQSVEQVSVAMEIYRYMINHYEPQLEEMEFLLQYEDPLSVIQSYWPKPDPLLGHTVMKKIREDARAELKERQEKESSLHGKLKKSARDIKRENDRKNSGKEKTGRTREKGR